MNAMQRLLLSGRFDASAFRCSGGYVGHDWRQRRWLLFGLCFTCSRCGRFR